MLRWICSCIGVVEMASALSFDHLALATTRIIAFARMALPLGRPIKLWSEFWASAQEHSITQSDVEFATHPLGDVPHDDLGKFTNYFFYLAAVKAAKCCGAVCAQHVPVEEARRMLDQPWKERMIKG